jgi:hypothetical protein
MSLRYTSAMGEGTSKRFFIVGAFLCVLLLLPYLDINLSRGHSDDEEIGESPSAKPDHTLTQFMEEHSDEQVRGPRSQRPSPIHEKARPAGTPTPVAGESKLNEIEQLLR